MTSQKNYISLPFTQASIVFPNKPRNNFYIHNLSCIDLDIIFYNSINANESFYLSPCTVDKSRYCLVIPARSLLSASSIC